MAESDRGDRIGLPRSAELTPTYSRSLRAQEHTFPPRVGGPIVWRAWLALAWAAWFGLLYARMLLGARAPAVLHTIEGAFPWIGGWSQ